MNLSSENKDASLLSLDNNYRIHPVWAALVKDKDLYAKYSKGITLNVIHSCEELITA